MKNQTYLLFQDLLILMVDVGSNITSFEKVKLCAFNIYKGKVILNSIH